MSILSAIGNFFKRIFSRPGLQDFLQKYEDLARKEVGELADINNGKDFHLWKDEAFNAIKAALIADGKNIHDNWISLLMHFAFEEIKAKLAQGATPEQTPPSS